MNRKISLGRVLSIIFLAAIVLYLPISGVAELVNSEKQVEIEADYAIKGTELHTFIDYLFPIGTDYFYYVYNEETNCLYAIRADKNWYTDNFTSDGQPEVEGFTIKTYTKSLNMKEASKVIDPITDLAKDMNINITISRDTYQDSLYVAEAVKKLIAAVLACLAVVGSFRAIALHGSGKSKVYISIALICYFAAFFIAIDTFRL